MPHYGLGDAIKATESSVKTIQNLQQGQTALALLPSDTRFAVVIEAIQKGANDSFYETDTTSFMPLFASSTTTPEGITGRFVGYLSFSDSKVRIYRVLDVNAAATGQTDSQQFTDTSPSAQLLLEDDITNLALSITQGEYVISNPALKFKLLQPYPITQLDGHFESSATGLQNGLQPTIKFMAAHGVSTARASKQLNAASIIVLLVIVVAVVVVIAVAKK